MPTKNYQSKSIRAFIGAKDYEASRAFYRALDFKEIVVGDKMCFFQVTENLGFYLQDYYTKDWIDNTMLFWEVADIEKSHQEILDRGLTKTFKNVRLSAIKSEEWGREFFLHDPSGILWHIGIFY